ncbi:MAG: transglutaminase-like domain-containing protein, partial [Candidatus Aenigmatarchaeota archaeon]
MKEIVFILALILLAFLLLQFSNYFPFIKVEEYIYNQTYKEFLPETKFYLSNETLKEAKETLMSFKSANCPSSYPIFCNNHCYQECKLGFLKCNETKGNCIYFQPDVRLLYNKAIENFVNLECEEKIDDSEEMKMFVSNLLPNFGSSVYPYVLYNFKIYEWIKNNIKYLPGYANTQEAKETLRLKAGKCDDQAILFASLSSSAGSIVRIRYIENCQHAWPEVFFPSKEIEDIVNEISFYAKEESIQYFEGEDGIWIPFDTTFKIGKIVEDCIPFLNESIVKYYCK